MFCYEIGPCPRCGSHLTGRLKPGREGETRFMFGSPVIYAADPEQYTCACANCGVRWVGVGKMVKRSGAEIKNMQKEWKQNVGSHPEYTKEEEVEIAGALYHGLQDENLVPQDAPDNGGFLKRAVRKWWGQTSRQGQSLIDDFYGLTNGNYYKWKDEIKDSDGQSDKEEEG